MDSNDIKTALLDAYHSHVDDKKMQFNAAKKEDPGAKAMTLRAQEMRLTGTKKQAHRNAKHQSANRRAAIRLARCVKKLSKHMLDVAIDVDGFDNNDNIH